LGFSGFLLNLSASFFFVFVFPEEKGKSPRVLPFAPASGGRARFAYVWPMSNFFHPRKKEKGVEEERVRRVQGGQGARRR